MKRFSTQELLAGILFFTACGWLLVDFVRSVPESPPSLWPLIPMFVAVVWYIVIEHRQGQGD